MHCSASPRHGACSLQTFAVPACGRKMLMLAVAMILKLITL
jgi:hypothetical protein